MSTEYHRLKPPFTSLRISEEGPHSKITVFCNGANTGTLCLRSGEEARAFVSAIHEEENFLVTYYAGKEAGSQIQMRDERLNPRDLRPDLQLVSEYGDLVTMESLLPNP